MNLLYRLLINAHGYCQDCSFGIGLFIDYMYVCIWTPQVSHDLSSITM